MASRSGLTNDERSALRARSANEYTAGLVLFLQSGGSLLPGDQEIASIESDSSFLRRQPIGIDVNFGSKERARSSHELAVDGVGSAAIVPVDNQIIGASGRNGSHEIKILFG